MVQHMVMPPHIIIMGMPLPIMVIICLQHCIIMSFMAGSIGVISHFMPSAVMVQFILHIIMGIIIMPPIGIPPIMGIPPIIGIIPDIMGFIIAFVIGIGIIAGIAIGVMTLSFFRLFSENLSFGREFKRRDGARQKQTAALARFPPS